MMKRCCRRFPPWKARAMIVAASAIAVDVNDNAVVAAIDENVDVDDFAVAK